MDRMRILLIVIVVSVILVQFTDSAQRINKDTPIPVKNSESPVIISQTKLGTRPILNRNVFFGNMFLRYNLTGAPVYRRRYPIHRTTVEIPDERAIRVNFTKEIMLGSNGLVCLNSSKIYFLAPDKIDRPTRVFTSVRYSSIKKGLPTHHFGDNRTVQIDVHALGQTVEITTNVLYNGTIVANTTCTDIKSVMKGTVVRMYATNPDADADLGGDAVNLQSSLFALILSTIFIYTVVWM